MVNKKDKSNEKKYGHIAVAVELKERFEELRFKLIGQEGKEITHESLLKVLLDSYEEKIKK